jgi:C4-dicarboxylate transporter DctQ subunit
VHTLNRIIDICIRGLAIIAGITLGLLLIAVCYATFSRVAFNDPMSNLIEYATYSLLYITFLSAPMLLQEKRHINVDIIITMLSKRRQAIASIITNIVGCLTSFVIFYFSFMATLTSFKAKVVVPDSMYTPQFLLLMVIPIGFFLLVIQFIRNIKEGVDIARTEGRRKD